MTVLQKAFVIILVFAKMKGENYLITDAASNRFGEVSEFSGVVTRSAWLCCCVVFICIIFLLFS